MNKTILNRTIAAILFGGVAAFCYPLQADSTRAKSKSTSTSADVQTTDTTAVKSRVHESIFDYKSPSLGKSHFTWGAEFGASVDIDGYDMSTFDVDVVIGYKNEFLKTLGINVGLHRDFHEGTTFVPLECVLRTGFVNRPTLAFFNFKAGYSFNTVKDLPTKGGFIFNAGVGFNLYSSRRVRSHLIISYQFIHLDKEQGIMIDKTKSHIDMVQMGLGVNF